MIKFEIYGYDEKPGEYVARWYWRAKAANGRTIADGAENYTSKSNARRAVLRFTNLLGATDFEIVELD